jgi:hypothetical protein
VKALGGKTPKRSTDEVSSLSSESKELAKSIEEGATRKEQPELKTLCLARDGNRCAISGVVDSSYEDQVNDVEKMNTGWTQCAHIIPFSTATMLEKNVSDTCA